MEDRDDHRREPVVDKNWKVVVVDRLHKEAKTNCRCWLYYII